MKMRRIKMVASLSGDAMSYAPDNEYDVEESFAVALCTEPSDLPRAVPVDWSLDDPDVGEPEADAAPESDETPEEDAAEVADATEVESDAGEPQDAEPEETREEEGDVEQATSPAAEKRETATQPLKRTAPKPPKKKKIADES